jgi:hypothetical protein
MTESDMLPQDNGAGRASAFLASPGRD